MSQPTHVVTCFLESDGKILVLLRSQRVGTYRGQWGGVAGFLESASPLEQAFTEIREETGLLPADIALTKQGKPLPVTDPSLNRDWVVHPFLFHVLHPEKIKLDWEHREMKWVLPDELCQLDAVPGLAAAYGRVAPPLSY